MVITRRQVVRVHRAHHSRFDAIALVRMNLDTPAARDDVQAIEQAFVVHWANFGRGPGGTYHDDGDLIWIEAPVVQLPCNAVMHTRLVDDVENRITRMIAHFRRRQVNFLWLVHPTAQPPDLSARLATNGLALVETATGMSLDLGQWAGRRPAAAPNVHGSIVYREVKTDAEMDAFEVLMAYY